jgi:phage gpG-like protein
VGAKLREKDNGLAKRLKSFAALKGLRGKVGIQGTAGDQQYEDGVTLAFVAAVHEFGAPDANVPERSFLRATYDANPTHWDKRLRDELTRVVKQGRDPRAALLVVMEELRSAIIDRINSGIDPPLAESTIQRKGESTPLVDTGILRGSITASVDQVST